MTQVNGGKRYAFLLFVVLLAVALAGIHCGKDEHPVAPVDIGLDGDDGAGKLDRRSEEADDGGRITVPVVGEPISEGGTGGGPFKGFVMVPAGEFEMGDGYGMCGFDMHSVTLTRDFFLGRMEVTNLFYAVMAQWAYDNGHVTVTTSSLRDNLDGSSVELLDLDDSDCRVSFSAGVFSVESGYQNHPVVEVSWYGAAAYCDWLSMKSGKTRAYDHSTWKCNGGDPYGAEGYRLPTDAEWEYAGQFDDERIWPWGNTAPVCGQTNFLGCVGGTTPVASYPAYTDLKVFDMAGNVHEWMNDWFVCNLGLDAQTDPVGPASGSVKVFNGGSFNNGQTWVRPSDRRSSVPTYASGYGGFRVARTR